MHLDVNVSRFDWPTPPAELGSQVAAVARCADELGVKTLSFMDHYFQLERLGSAADPMLEGYTTLAFVAGLTQRVRLRLLATGVTYRHPGLLAKTVATLDVLSRGRADLGIGAAWYEREHRGLGVPFPPLSERFERLEETLQICRQMWGPDDGPYYGAHYRLEETLCRPRPLSTPHPGILVAGGGERKTLRLVAKYASSCNLLGEPDVVAQKCAVLQRHCVDLGRDPGEIEVTAMFRGLTPQATADDVLRAAERFAAVGVSTLVTGAAGPDGSLSADSCRWLERTFAPVMHRLAAIRPAPIAA